MQEIHKKEELEKLLGRFCFVLFFLDFLEEEADQEGFLWLLKMIYSTLGSQICQTETLQCEQTKRTACNQSNPALASESCMQSYHYHTQVPLPIIPWSCHNLKADWQKNVE